jgi:hypothetical protein
MHEENENSWSDEQPDDEAKLNMQKMLNELQKRTDTAMKYLLAEGFVEASDTPGVFKYTPEGYVLAQQQYEALKKQGLI